MVAVALKENVASTRVMEKVGLVKLFDCAFPGFDQPAVVYARDYVRAAGAGN